MPPLGKDSCPHCRCALASGKHKCVDCGDVFQGPGAIAELLQHQRRRLHYGGHLAAELREERLKGKGAQQLTQQRESRERQASGGGERMGQKHAESAASSTSDDEEDERGMEFSGAYPASASTSASASVSAPSSSSSPNSAFASSARPRARLTEAQKLMDPRFFEKHPAAAQESTAPAPVVKPHSSVSSVSGRGSGDEPAAAVEVSGDRGDPDRGILSGSSGAGDHSSEKKVGLQAEPGSSRSNGIGTDVVRGAPVTARRPVARKGSDSEPVSSPSNPILEGGAPLTARRPVARKGSELEPIELGFSSESISSSTSTGASAGGHVPGPTSFEDHQAVEPSAKELSSLERCSLPIAPKKVYMHSADNPSLNGGVVGNALADDETEDVSPLPDRESSIQDEDSGLDLAAEIPTRDGVGSGKDVSPTSEAVQSLPTGGLSDFVNLRASGGTADVNPLPAESGAQAVSDIVVVRPVDPHDEKIVSTAKRVFADNPAFCLQQASGVHRLADGADGTKRKFADDMAPSNASEKSKDGMVSSDGPEKIKFTVEKVCDMRGSADARMCFIKWAGYPESENTWEPAANVPSEFIDAFLQGTDASCEQGGHLKFSAVPGSGDGGGSKQRKTAVHRISDSSDLLSSALSEMSSATEELNQAGSARQQVLNANGASSESIATGSVGSDDLADLLNVGRGLEFAGHARIIRFCGDCEVRKISGADPVDFAINGFQAQLAFDAEEAMFDSREGDLYFTFGYDIRDGANVFSVSRGGDSGVQMKMESSLPGGVFAKFIETHFRGVAETYPDVLDDVMIAVFGDPKLQKVLSDIFEAQRVIGFARAASELSVSDISGEREGVPQQRPDISYSRISLTVQTRGNGKHLALQLRKELWGWTNFQIIEANEQRTVLKKGTGEQGLYVYKVREERNGRGSLGVSAGINLLAADPGDTVDVVFREDTITITPQSPRSPESDHVIRIGRRPKSHSTREQSAGPPAASGSSSEMAASVSSEVQKQSAGPPPTASGSSSEMAASVSSEVQKQSAGPPPTASGSSSEKVASVSSDRKRQIAEGAPTEPAVVIRLVTVSQIGEIQYGTSFTIPLARARITTFGDVKKRILQINPQVSILARLIFRMNQKVSDDQLLADFDMTPGTVLPLEVRLPHSAPFPDRALGTLPPPRQRRRVESETAPASLGASTPHAAFGVVPFDVELHVAVAKGHLVSGREKEELGLLSDIAVAATDTDLYEVHLRDVGEQDAQILKLFLFDQFHPSPGATVPVSAGAQFFWGHPPPNS